MLMPIARSRTILLESSSSASRLLRQRSCTPLIKFSGRTTTFSRFSSTAKYFGRRNLPKGNHLNATTVNTQSKIKITWKQLAWFVKVTRIPILIGAVYSLGYQQGVLDSVRNPNKIQQVRYLLLSFQNCCERWKYTNSYCTI
jgi:hypothetical protein